MSFLPRPLILALRIRVKLNIPSGPFVDNTQRGQVTGSHLSYFKGNLDRNKSKMSSVQDLEGERKQLEDKIHLLVDKLESQKKPEQIKVPKEAIVRSREEEEAAAALERLAIKQEEEASKKAAEAAGTTKSAKTDDKAQAKKGKGGKGGRGEEAAAPDRPVDISRLDLRVGKIIEVDRHPDADALYVEKIDCGDPTGPRTVISGLVKHVPIEEMKDRLVVVLCNLKPAKMRGILSEAMVMCASTPEKVELLGTPPNVKPGDRVVFDNYPGEPDTQLNPKKKIWESVAPDIKTDDNGVATYKGVEFKVAGVDGQFKSNLKNVNIR